MRTKLLIASLSLLAAVAGWHAHAASRAEAADKEEGPALVHNVFFKLHESTAENKKKLVAGCRKYLTKHDGEVYFAAGPIAEELKGGVNDRDFDVALTIVFKSKAAHDAYQPSKRHQEFIREYKAMFKKVRVFDSLAEK